QETPSQKKQKIEDSPPSQKDSFSTPKDGNDSDSDATKDLPDCVYGEKCYRKNPLHSKQFRHPKKVRIQNQGKSMVQSSKEEEEIKTTVATTVVSSQTPIGAKVLLFFISN